MRLNGNVLITGGTGSLGQAIVRRAKRDSFNCKIIIFSRDEYKQSMMKRIHPHCKYVLGDVRDAEAIEMASKGVDYIIHTAAYKQVPSSEVNALEATKTNIFGSMNVAVAAIKSDVIKVIGISTDKACSPINCYGQTKAVMERLYQSMDSRTKFNLVRYGNVVGSRGSIIPHFLTQASKGGPLTITDRRMCRFWLTLQESVDLILIALSESEAGTIIVPELPSMSVLSLANMLSDGCKITDIGIRPGEKIHETLVNSNESMHTVRFTYEGKHYYRIFPASMGIPGNLPDGYEFRTDCAKSLSVEEMQSLIDKVREDENDLA